MKNIYLLTKLFHTARNQKPTIHILIYGISLKYELFPVLHTSAEFQNPNIEY